MNLGFQYRLEQPFLQIPGLLVPDTAKILKSDFSTIHLY